MKRLSKAVIGKISDFLMLFYDYNNRILLTVNKKVKNPILKAIILLCLFPFILIKGILSLLYDYTLGKLLIVLRLKKEQDINFAYELGFVAIIKDEADYIREWISYHTLVCNNNTVFYIYDNESGDNVKEVLNDYIESGLVVYKYFPGKYKQLPAYEDAIKNYKNECRYLAFIDIDEFIVPNDDVILSDLVKNIIGKRKNVVGLGINWLIYGSSDYEQKTEGLVTERFIKRSEDNFWGNEHVKTIANPRFITKYISCHYPKYRLGAWNIDSNGKRQRLWYNKKPKFDIIRLHHYFGKSKEEFEIKKKRGWADQVGAYKDWVRFEEYNRNEIKDDIMLRYVERIKKII